MAATRKRRHDDAHYPMQGRGKRALRPARTARSPLLPLTLVCSGCSAGHIDHPGDDPGRCRDCGTALTR